MASSSATTGADVLRDGGRIAAAVSAVSTPSGASSSSSYEDQRLSQFRNLIGITCWPVENAFRKYKGIGQRGCPSNVFNVQHRCFR
jgi:hypothetical protein